MVQISTSKSKYFSSFYYIMSHVTSPDANSPLHNVGERKVQKVDSPAWHKIVSRRGSSPLPCVILRNEYLLFLCGCSYVIGSCQRP